MKLPRKEWDWLTVLATALDYAHADARTSGLERELRRLKDELGRIVCLPNPSPAGSNQVRQSAKPDGAFARERASQEASYRLFRLSLF